MHIFRGAIPFIAAVSLFGQSASKQATSSQAGPIHVFASNGMKAVILDLQPQAERALARPLAIDFGSTTGLLEKVNAGAPFDLAILTSDAIANLVKEGKLAAATQTELSRCGVGFAVRSGAPRPDIGTPEAMKQALLKAKSIAYAKDGASRPTVENMFDRLGVAAALKSKLVLTTGSGPAMEAVASGQTAVVLTLISDLMPVHGIDIVGPLPADLQGYVSFGAAANSKTANAEAARLLIAQLRAPAAAAVYKAKGMEPR
jgi:molybdate transport system substrate-binding protein